MQGYILSYPQALKGSSYDSFGFSLENTDFLRSWYPTAGGETAVENKLTRVPASFFFRNNAAIAVRTNERFICLFCSLIYY